MDATWNALDLPDSAISVAAVSEGKVIGEGEMDWQPIASAPKDGTLIELRRVYEGSIVAEGQGYFGGVTIKYSDGPRLYRDVWVDQDTVHFFPEPTHW